MHTIDFLKDDILKDTNTDPHLYLFINHTYTVEHYNTVAKMSCLMATDSGPDRFHLHYESTESLEYLEAQLHVSWLSDTYTKGFLCLNEAGR